MKRIPVDRHPLPKCQNEDVIRAWKWFMSFISDREWAKRKHSIEKAIAVDFKGQTKMIFVVVKEDLISWYLYLLDTLINEPHKYENFQGARIVPIFERLGKDLDKLKSIGGIERRVKDLVRKRRSEADAFIFEFLTALTWVRNGYEVSFVDEKGGQKTPDLRATKSERTWYIECKRQSKTSDYTYRETAKRQKMISLLANTLIQLNILLDITFHVELESLPDTFLKDLLEAKLPLAVSGKIISNEQVDIDLTFVDIAKIQEHLQKYSVKYGSPMLNKLIGKDSVDGKGFTCGIYAELFRVGEGDAHNVFISDISNAYGVYWRCDANESVFAKARDIKKQLYSAMQQFNSQDTAIIHVGIETFDGPQVEKARVEKILQTVEQIDPASTPLRWIFCHFFQAYSPHDQLFVFDETVSSLSPYANANPPIKKRLMIIPDNADLAQDIFHWNRPSP